MPLQAFLSLTQQVRIPLCSRKMCIRDRTCVHSVWIRWYAITLPSLPQAPCRCAQPVSYTHLDVYKRQLWNLCVAAGAFEGIFPGMAVRADCGSAIPVVCGGNGGTSAGTVSYTHLVPQNLSSFGKALILCNIVKNAVVIQRHDPCLLLYFFDI